MKYFIIFFLTLLSTSCNLFQRQQPAAETVTVKKQQQEEVFVPVQKELYVIDKEEREDNYLFGEKIKISAEGNEFYKTKIHHHAGDEL